MSKNEIQKYLRENLSLSITEREWGYGGTLIIRLKLGDETIGPSYAIEPELKFKTDHGHGGGSYADDVELNISPTEDIDDV